MHPQYDLHSCHMAVCKQAAGTNRCRKVVFGLCWGKEAQLTNFDQWGNVTVSDCTRHVY